MGCSISKRLKQLKELQLTAAPLSTSSSVMSEKKPETPCLLPPAKPIQDSAETKREKAWCQQQLAQWREDREKSKSIEEVFEWPKALTKRMDDGDKASMKRREERHKALVERRKEKFLRRVQLQRTERKKLAQSLPSDDTIYEMPTRMPIINFSGYVGSIVEERGL